MEVALLATLIPPRGPFRSGLLNYTNTQGVKGILTTWRTCGRAGRTGADSQVMTIYTGGPIDGSPG